MFSGLVLPMRTALHQPEGNNTFSDRVPVICTFVDLTDDAKYRQIDRQKKGKYSNQLLFCHNNKVKPILESWLILESTPPDLSPGLDSTQAWTQIWGLDSRIILDSRIRLTLLLWQKVADLKIYLFLLPNKTEWSLVYSPETHCLHSAACCTHCTEELDQQTREIPFALGGQLKTERVISLVCACPMPNLFRIMFGCS